MGTIAAPLLAGISITLTAIVLTSPSAFGWANVSLGLLVVAAGAFVATVEFSIMARQYAITPSDFEAWWPDHDTTRRAIMLRAEQRLYRSLLTKWVNRARHAYNLGIFALCLAVVTLLVPHKGVCHMSAGRCVVSALALTGLVSECIWIACTRSPTLNVTLNPEEEEELGAAQ